MVELAQTPLPKPDAGEISPASENPAVARCCEAYARVSRSPPTRARATSMPLSTVQKPSQSPACALQPENIRDFIACVAHGTLIGTIQGPDAARLLYAAQVAHTRPAPSQPARIVTPSPGVHSPLFAHASEPLLFTRLSDQHRRTSSEKGLQKGQIARLCQIDRR